VFKDNVLEKVQEISAACGYTEEVVVSVMVALALLDIKVKLKEEEGKQNGVRDFKGRNKTGKLSSGRNGRVKRKVP
jgi:hypothetical protein